MPRPTVRTKSPGFFWYNGRKVRDGGIRLPARIEKAIRQKHEHETEGHPPLWLIWLDRQQGDGVRLNAVANSVEAARYGCFSVSDQGEVWVERIPANHGFASSIQENITRAKFDAARELIRVHGPDHFRYTRTGD